VRREVGKEQATLPSGKPRLDPASVDLEDEAAAKLYVPARQGAANIVPTAAPYNEPDSDEEDEPMAKQITCECGRVIRGTSDHEVMQGAREHIRSDHPELLDQVSEDDLRGWIEEV
jgi:predicted small metal-binding protein